MSKEKIIELEETLRQSMLNSDVEKLDSLIADSLVFTLPTGDIINKDMDLNAHRTGIQKISQLDPSNQRIQIYNTTAIVTVKMVMSGTYDNHPFKGIYSYTRVWQKSGEDWKIIAGHAHCN